MALLTLQQQIIYGPVRSRRLGHSLGINLMPTQYKLCPFNCVYCQYGWTNALTTAPLLYQSDLPSPAQVQKALIECLNTDVKADYLTFSGNGEATIHPQFEEIVDIVTSVRNDYLPQARTCILSNSAVVNREEVRQGLEKLDVRIMKLDAGDEDTFIQLNRPAMEVKFNDIVAGLYKLSSFTMQSLFVRGDISNVEPERLARWIDLVGQLRPREVQIYSIDRTPAYSRLIKVSDEELLEIGERTQTATSIPVKVFSANSKV